MPSPDTLFLALLIIAVLVVELVILWQLTKRNTASVAPTVAPVPAADPYADIPAPSEPFPPVPADFQRPQATLDARYAHQQRRRRAAPMTRPLAEEDDWYRAGYGSGSVGGYGSAPWGGGGTTDERDDDGYGWPQAR